MNPRVLALIAAIPTTSTALARDALAQDAPAAIAYPPPAPATAPLGASTLDTLVVTENPYRPRLLFGALVGGGDYIGGNTDANAGPVWGASFGVRFGRVFDIEARYTGAYNSTPSQVAGASNDGNVTSGFAVLMRVVAPMHYVRPFFQVGIGGQHVSSGQSGQGTPVQGRGLADFGYFPVGSGLEVSILRNLALSVEVNYHALSNSWFPPSDINTRGAIWHALGGVRLAL